MVVKGEDDEDVAKDVLLWHKRQHVQSTHSAPRQHPPQLVGVSFLKGKFLMNISSFDV